MTCHLSFTAEAVDEKTRELIVLRYSGSFDNEGVAREAAKSLEKKAKKMYGYLGCHAILEAPIIAYAICNPKLGPLTGTKYQNLTL